MSYTGFENYSDSELLRVCEGVVSSRCLVELIQRVANLDVELEHVNELKADLTCALAAADKLRETEERLEDENEELQEEVLNLRYELSETKAKLEVVAD